MAGKQLPEGFSEKLRSLIGDLEANDKASQRAEFGEIELKVSEEEALWFVAYRTAQ
ncbi:hypothetical protein ACFWPX_33330 [Nocardia sp. NPDC058518]|uniref:hypothetical protein n=1 Tax=Nocardia sp. NPDC058518 TaxID=3346534 RepID=UPI003656B877